MDELFTPYHTPFSSAPLSPDPGLRVYLLSRQIIADNTLRVSEQNYDVGAKLVSNNHHSRAQLVLGRVFFYRRVLAARRLS